MSTSGYDAVLLYAPGDKAIAGTLAQRLRELGLSLLWNKDLEPTLLGKQELTYFFTQARQVIALCSENAGKPDGIERGLAIARDLNKKTVPCLIGGTPADTTQLLADLPESHRAPLIDLRSDTEGLDSTGVQKLAGELAPS